MDLVTASSETPDNHDAELETLLEEYRSWRTASPFALVFFFSKRLAIVIKALFQQITNLLSLGVVTTVAVRAIGLNWYQGVFLAIGFVLLLVLILAILEYRRFRFRITQESVAVKSGILRITQTDVRWERVRAVNLERGPIERTFALAQVSLDTAGSAEAEVQVPAIKLQLAELLRAKVSLETKKSHTIGEEITKSGETLYHMNFGQLVKASLCTQGTLLLAMAMLGTIAWLAGTLSSYLPEWEQTDGEFWVSLFNNSQVYYANLAAGIEGLTGLPITQSWIGMTVPAILGVLLLVGILFLGRALYFCAINYDLQLLRRDDALSTVRGLLTKKRTNVKLERVQSIWLKLNVREISLKLGRLNAMQSMSGKEHMLSLPSTPRSIRDTVVELTSHEGGSQLKLDPKTQSFQRISLVYFWKLFLIPTIAALLAVVLASVFVDFDWYYWVWIGLSCGWIPICFLVSMVRWLKAGYAIDSSAMISRSGLLGYFLEMGKFKKVHRVHIEQSFIQRFTGKSTLVVHFATTQITIPFLPRDRAVQLHNYIMYVISVREPGWQ